MLAALQIYTLWPKYL